MCTLEATKTTFQLDSLLVASSTVATQDFHACFRVHRMFIPRPRRIRMRAGQFRINRRSVSSTRQSVGHVIFPVIVCWLRTITTPLLVCSPSASLPLSWHQTIDGDCIHSLCSRCNTNLCIFVVSSMFGDLPISIKSSRDMLRTPPLTRLYNLADVPH